MTEVFVGLDGEMTGSSTEQGISSAAERYVLIQIGVAFKTSDVYRSDIGWPKGSYNFEREALEVNGFTHRRIQNARACTVIDDELTANIKRRRIEKKQLVAVGWNVGGFDMPFVRKYLPSAASYFSYRAVDLNSACFAVGGGGRGYVRVKQHVKNLAEAEVGAGRIHDAGYDAVTSLAAFKVLRRLLDGTIQMPRTSKGG